MIIKETRKEMVEREVTVKTEYKCDRCGGQIEREEYSKRVAKIVLKDGLLFPEGGSIDIEEAYFCEDCAVKIRKILSDNGVKFTQRTLDI